MCGCVLCIGALVVYALYPLPCTQHLCLVRGAMADQHRPSGKSWVCNTCGWSHPWAHSHCAWCKRSSQQRPPQRNEASSGGTGQGSRLLGRFSSKKTPTSRGPSSEAGSVASTASKTSALPTWSDVCAGRRLLEQLESIKITTKKDDLPGEKSAAQPNTSEKPDPGSASKEADGSEVDAGVQPGVVAHDHDDDVQKKASGSIDDDIEKLSSAHAAVAQSLGTEHEATKALGEKLEKLKKEREAANEQQPPQKKMLNTSRKVARLHGRVQQIEKQYKEAEEAAAKALAFLNITKDRLDAEQAKLLQAQQEQSSQASRLLASRTSGIEAYKAATDEEGSLLIDQLQGIVSKLHEKIGHVPEASSALHLLVGKKGTEQEEKDDSDFDSDLDLPEPDDVQMGEAFVPLPGVGQRGQPPRVIQPPRRGDEQPSEAASASGSRTRTRSPRG